MRATDGAPDAVGTIEPAVAWLTVDLGAIVTNWRRIRDHVAPAECAAVVKADAYGLGASRIAPALAEAGCRLFFVARLAEAMALRLVLPEVEIAVLDGLEPFGPDAFIADRLIPVLSEAVCARRWITHCRSIGAARPAILHLDTGLNRLGIQGEKLDDLLAEHPEAASFPWRAVISHLACATEADHPMNPHQRDAFRSLATRFPGRPLSLAATSGCYLGADYAFDLVRPGAGLYGIAPFEDGPNPFAQAVRMTAKILQARSIDTGECVGYGAAFVASAPTRVATIAAGYADGFPRAAGGIGVVHLGAIPLPVIGRISMDLMTVDVSGVPVEAVRPGAEVDLLGPHRMVDALARDAGTIGYEILTRLGTRLPRRYLDA